MGESIFVAEKKHKSIVVEGRGDAVRGNRDEKVDVDACRDSGSPVHYGRAATALLFYGCSVRVCLFFFARARPSLSCESSAVSASKKKGDFDLGSRWGSFVPPPAPSVVSCAHNARDADQNTKRKRKRENKGCVSLGAREDEKGMMKKEGEKTNLFFSDGQGTPLRHKQKTACEISSIGQRQHKQTHKMTERHHKPRPLFIMPLRQKKNKKGIMQEEI